MKSREFGTWPPRNGLGASRQKLYDEYNLSFKKERPPQPREYASSDVEEYYRVPETKDVSGNPYEQNSDVLSSQSNRTRSASAAKRQLMLRQVAGLLVGSVVIATTYQAMAERQPVSDPPAVVQTEEQEPISLFPSWNWSDDKQTVILELCDADGKLIKEIPATVGVSEMAATCNQEGSKTYTATAEDGDNQYSDSQSETLPPLGHAFDEGKVTVLENGQTAITFECTRCHEQFTIATSMTEND